MRTTVSIDDALLERAKRRAGQQGVTLGGYVEEAIREYLATPRTVALKPVNLPVSTGGRLRAGIDPSSNRDLFDALDDSTS